MKTAGLAFTATLWLSSLRTSLASSTTENDAAIHVHHRIINLSSSDVAPPPFAHRGVITASSSSSDQSSPKDLKFHPDPESFDQISRWIAEGGDKETVYYQVGVKAEGGWDVQSVKLCHVPHSTSDHFILHPSPSASSPSFDWFEYALEPVPRDGSCSPATLPARKKAKRGGEVVKVLGNSTVEVRELGVVPQKVTFAQQLTPQENKIKELREQSFLQKYWMYILGGVVIFAMATPPDTEEGGAAEGGQAGSGGAGGRPARGGGGRK